MHRNMHGRVEVMTPVYLEESKIKMADFLQVILDDERSAWDLQENGNYIQRSGENKTGTHQVMMRKTLEELQTTDL